MHILVLHATSYIYDMNRFVKDFKRDINSNIDSIENAENAENNEKKKKNSNLIKKKRYLRNVWREKNFFFFILNLTLNFENAKKFIVY